MSNSLDPDQDRQNVGPDLDPNCLQRLSADDSSRQRFDCDRERSGTEGSRVRASPALCP